MFQNYGSPTRVTRLQDAQTWQTQPILTKTDRSLNDMSCILEREMNYEYNDNDYTLNKGKYTSGKKSKCTESVIDANNNDVSNSYQWCSIPLRHRT